MSQAPSPVRVLYVDNSYSFGGAIISLAHLVRGLDPHRYEAHVVSGQPSSSLEKLFPSVETRHLRQKLPWRDGRLHRTLRTLPGFRNGPWRKILDRGRAAYWMVVHHLPTAIRYYRIARQTSADIIHLNNNVESQVSAILAARLAGIPCVAHSQSFQAPQAALRWYASMVDHHIAISHAVRENLVELGVDDDRVSVIHHAVDVEAMRTDARRSDPAKEFGIEEGDFVFGLFGRVVPWKGTLEFVEAAVEVIREAPSARAFVVGDASDGDAGYFERVRTLAKRSGLGDRIVFTGYRDDVAALMAMMDVVVHASTAPEPFGMVLIEAMALGKPVIATHGGGPEDIVLEGETGLLVDRSSPSDLRRALVELLEDPRRRGSMGTRAAERAAECFTSHRYAAEVMDLYEGLLQRPTAASARGTSPTP